MFYALGTNKNETGRAKMFEFTGLFGLIILILDIWAIVNIIGSNSSTGNKVLWIVLILILPLVGLILWLLLGQRAPG